MTSQPDDTLTLIDGSGYIFRAFYALPRMTRADGTPVNAVYGFCSMMLKLTGEMQARRMAVVFDAARKTFRNEIYPAYKANRPPPPEELVPQFPLIREAAVAFGFPVVEREGYEADDLIATYAAQARAAGLQVRIVSADKDLMQLVREGVALFDPMKAVPIGADEVRAKFGVVPERVVDVQALAGDSTDNVPGVPGIGVKTAAQLIETFGDLENLLANLDRISQPKRREVLTQNADLARISKKLVTLRIDAPAPEPLEKLWVRENHLEERRAFLEAQGFRSLLVRAGVAPSAVPVEAPRAPEPVAAYALVQDRAALERWVAEAREIGFVALDTETDGLVPSNARLVGLSLATAPGHACYVPFSHRDPEDGDGLALSAKEPLRQIALSDLRDVLLPLLHDSSILKIGHNLKFDWQVLAAALAVDESPLIASFDDTMLMSYVLAEGGHGHGLDELAQLVCGHRMISFDEVTGTGKARITFDRVPLDKACAYAAEDADFTLRLWLALKPKLLSAHVMHVYERLERPLIPVVAAMEQTGVKVDETLLRQQGAALGQRLLALEVEVHALAGHPFNLGSPKQLGDVLFAEMGLPGGSKGKTGAYGTSHDVLEPLADAGHEIVQKLLAWRALAKLKSTYTDALPEQISRKTGRVHTSFSLVGALTGRLSSTDPNLQNIPVKTDDGRAIRRAFVAETGHVLLSVDYSQIELRLAAEMADIAALKQAFSDGVDIHALTASQVFGLPLADVPAEKRRQAKAINFGIIYGISGFGLAKQIGCSPSEAAAFIRAYLDRFKELRDWIEATKSFATTHGYVETLFGRHVPVLGIHEKNAMRRAAAERQAINAPLQGTAADIIKRAMIRLPDALVQAGFRARLLLQVHDELVLEVPSAEIEPTAALVQAVMEQAPEPARRLSVPLVAEANWAANWAEAH
jgi:DNA polymerase-1